MAKKLKFIATQINHLKNKYKNAEIYLIRNELDYFLFSPKNGRRFSPDYMLIINDTQNKEMYYQCLMEPKGGHILEKDLWKEESLIEINDSEILFNAENDAKEAYKEYLNQVKKLGYKEIKSLGIKFYNTDPRHESDFALDFSSKLLN